jgi:hypothetical protein
LGNLFLAGGVGEIDPARFDPLQDRSDGVWPAERTRHLRIALVTHALEIVDVFHREEQSFDLC